jgi:hypothetical protein
MAVTLHKIKWARKSCSLVTHVAFKLFDMEVCYWAVIFTPLVILRHLVSFAFLYLFSNFSVLIYIDFNLSYPCLFYHSFPFSFNFQHLVRHLFCRSFVRDRLCGLVVRVLGYRSGGPDSNPGTTRKKTVVGLERGPLSLVSTTEELLDRKVAAPV